MEQDDAWSGGIATLEVMEPKALARDEATDWRVPPFSDKRERYIPNHQHKENTRDDRENGFSSRHSPSLATPVASRMRQVRRQLRHNRAISLSFLTTSRNAENTGKLGNGLTEIALLGKELGQVINLQSAEKQRWQTHARRKSLRKTWKTQPVAPARGLQNRPAV